MKKVPEDTHKERQRDRETEPDRQTSDWDSIVLTWAADYPIPTRQEWAAVILEIHFEEFHSPKKEVINQYFGMWNVRKTIKKTLRDNIAIKRREL